MNRIIFLASWGFCLVFLSGCGEKFPADFPKVYPITVTVKDGETPLPKVTVTFIPAVDRTTAAVSYYSSGVTDEKGVAAISTIQGSFVKKGIPQGEFIVTAEDIVDLDSGLSAEEKLNMSREDEFKLYQEQKRKIAEHQKKVPEVLCKPKAETNEETSPIRFTASKGRNELIIDVAQYKE